MKKTTIFWFLSAIVCFLVDLVAAQSPESARTTLGHPVAYVRVANSQAYWNYKIDIAFCAPRLINEGTKSQDAKYPPQLVDILRNLQRNRKSREETADSIKADWASGIKWAEYSTDRQFVVAGYEDPVITVMRKATIFMARTGTPVHSIICGDESIQDILWSTDSRYLIVIKQTEHWSLSLDGILKMISGHPVPVVSLDIEIIDVPSRRVSRSKCVEGIKYAEGILSPAL
jgi:hypothetical protein